MAGHLLRAVERGRRRPSGSRSAAWYQGNEAFELLRISWSSEPVNQCLESIIDITCRCRLLRHEHEYIQLNRSPELPVDRSKK
jgi:hypothetical protein